VQFRKHLEEFLNIQITDEAFDMRILDGDEPLIDIGVFRDDENEDRCIVVAVPHTLVTICPKEKEEEIIDG